jgi:hypothetical protein
MNNDKIKTYNTNIDSVIKQIQGNMIHDKPEVIKIKNKYYGIYYIFKGDGVSIDAIFLAEIKRDKNNNIYTDIENEFILEEIFYVVGIFEEYELIENKYDTITEMYQHSIKHIKNAINYEYINMLTTEQIILLLENNINKIVLKNIVSKDVFTKNFNENDGIYFVKRIINLKYELSNYENNCYKYVSNRMDEWL